MIVAVIAAYNSAETLLKCLLSLQYRVDKILCFDAQWIGFPYPSLHSDDDTELLINCLNDDGVIVPPIRYIQLSSPIHQYEMRNAMIGHVPDGDWIFNIDADEYVVHWDRVSEILESTTERGFRICDKYPKERCAMPTFRLVKKTQGMHWSKDHRVVEDCNGEIPLHRLPILTNVVIDHHPIANQKRMRPFMETYKEWLHSWETQNR